MHIEISLALILHVGQCEHVDKTARGNTKSTVMLLNKITSEINKTKYIFHKNGATN